MDDLISLTIRIDNRLLERRREQQQHGGMAETKPWRVFTGSPEELSTAEEPRGTEPMQLGRKRLDPEERENVALRNAVAFTVGPRITS